MTKPAPIFWPPGFEPQESPVHARNEIAIPFSKETVWAWLVRAKLWPSWYPNSANIEFLDGAPPDLELGTRFRWKTFGVTLKSIVREFVPFERLAWDAQRVGVKAYHAWLIQPTAEGCHVLTEETQKGVLARLGKALRPKQLEQMHQIWLEQLKIKASTGLPSTS